MRASAALIATLLGASAHAAAAEANGYIDSRTQFSRANVGGVIPTRDLPQLQELVEANVQVRSRYAGRGFVYGDVSLFGLFVGSYRDIDENGNEVVVPDHHPPGTDPLVALSELYLSHDLTDELNVLLGKKRIIWGPSLAFNPTDLINPPKDPTDPSFQRAGAYLAQIEYTLPTFTFTFNAAPAVIRQASGIPYRFLTYPEWDKQDDALHYQLAARAYALVADSDINLMLFYGNEYTELEPFPDRLRVGASFSRYFFTDYELHTELLLQKGSARLYANAVCMADVPALARCLQTGEPLADRGRLNENTLLPKAVIGMRRQFNDESLLSLEYLYQADGYNQRQFEDYVRFIAFATRVPRAPIAVSDATSRTDQGTPQKFSFQPIAKHYAFLTYQKPRIREDFTLSATAIVNMQDWSGLLTPALSWQATEWMQLIATGFLPWPGIADKGATIPAVELPALGISTPETTVTEYSLLPMEYRAVLQVRVFY